jgi:hypothetical protein
VQAAPAALDELRHLGVSVPALAVGDRVAHGWNPQAYARLLGVAYTPPRRLSPPELAQRLDRVLEATHALVRGFDQARLDHRPPERDRTVRDLAYHVFRLSLACIEGMDRGHLPHAWLGETAPGDLVDGPAVARYGALVRGRLQGWFAGAGEDEYARVVDAYYGPQTGHELLERTTWHAAQHLRQLHVLAGRLGVRRPETPPDELFADLPMPAALW